MEVTVRKIKATKSVIQQIPVASLEDKAYHKEVFGFCVFPASGKSPMRRYILFHNKTGEVRKFHKPKSVEVKRFNTGWELIISYAGVPSKGLKMLNPAEAEYICEKINELIKKAEEAGQFYY